jgi:putative oxidoreductase
MTTEKLEGLMRNAALLGTRLVIGGYLAVHGAQKLFGAFGGSGLDKAGAGFHRMGLRPGRHMAMAAGISELGGGVLTAAGIADPAGPLAIMGTMVVASTTHRAKGPLNSRGGRTPPSRPKPPAAPARTYRHRDKAGVTMANGSDLAAGVAGNPKPA